MGNALAVQSIDFSYSIFILSLFTAIGFQIISNFANDYGDGIKGTDNNLRLGPERTFQRGLLKESELKKGIIICSIISIFLSIILIYIALGSNSFLVPLLFILLAFSSVISAIKYTLGNSAYGYSGFGDLFVFIFFGMVSVLGAYYLQSKTLDLRAIYFAISIGLLSVGVLNLNNMRDIANDRNSNKNTLVVILGIQKSKLYHYSLIIISAITLLMGVGVNQLLNHQSYLLIYFPLLFHFFKVSKIKESKDYDSLLKELSLTTFFISLFLFFNFSLN
jgi:1,4-dihydroxy-2-naphthoate octaprenyltransferase